MGPLAAASEIVREVDATLVFFLVFSLVLLVGIVATMVFFVVRYRRSRTPTTKQIESNTKLEVVWTVIPTAIVIGLFFVGYEGFRMMRNPPVDAMVIEATAQRWFFSFRYPETGVTSPDLYVPVNRAIRLNISAPIDDVTHAVYIPAFRVKEDAVPGQATYLWFQPEEPGVHTIFCAEFCGKDHSRMISELHILEPAAFEAWMDQQIAERYRPVPVEEAMDADREELEGHDVAALWGKYCAACHGVQGTGGGPYQARDLTTLAGWKRGPKCTDVFRTISEGLEGTQMRGFGHLPVRERLALMHAVLAFHPTDRPLPTADDLAFCKERYPELDPDKAPAVPRPGMPIEEAMDQIVKEAP